MRMEHSWTGVMPVLTERLQKGLFEDEEEGTISGDQHKPSAEWMHWLDHVFLTSEL